MHLEIELQSPEAKQELYELRNYLQEHVPGLRISVKELPPQEGHMGLVTTAILTGLIEAATGFTMHQAYESLLKPTIDQWMHSINPKGKLEIMSTLKDGDTKMHFVQNDAGETRVYEHVNYAVNTDRTHALLIGSSEFETGFNAIPPVHGNLEDFYRLLTDKRHFGLPHENVVVAYNKSNTEVEELLLSNSRLPEMDTLIVYYAGHGHRTDVKKLYLIARNTKKIDDYILGGIDFDFINNVVLKSSTAKQKILILDACHSGIATQGSDTMVADLDVKGTYILTSSPGDEVSYFDKKGRNTYFTGALLDVLKNGIDNTNEMLALEDLYDQARTQLQQKNFPQPISKSQLNISPSQFFISRNPLFSVDKLKRRPGMLYNQGKHQEALYEYDVLLQKYPDDLQLRKEADHCRSQILFTQLVNDADELFYQYNNYPDALEKYRKALLVKADDMVRSKISKCEERIRSANVKSSSQDKHQDNLTSTYKSPLKQNQGAGPTSRSRTSDTQEQSVLKEKDLPTIQPAPISSKNAIVIAISWLFLVFVAYLSTLKFYWGVWYLPSLAVLLVTAILFLVKGKRMSNTEWLIYIYAALPAIWHVVGFLSRQHSTLVLSILFACICAIVYFRMFMKRVTEFNILQFIFGNLAFIFLAMLVGGASFFGIAEAIDPTDSDEYAITGLWLGALTGVSMAIYMIPKWRRRKPGIPSVPPPQIP